MISPLILGEIGDKVLKLQQKLDDSLIEMVAQEIVKAGKVTELTQFRLEALQNSGMLYENILSEIAKHTGKAAPEIQKMFLDAGFDSVQYDAAIYKAAGYDPIPLHMSPVAMEILKAVLKKTGGLVENLTKTTALSTQTAYINACTLAEMQVTSGGVDYITAIGNAIKSAIDDSSWVLYPSGSRARVDVAVRRSVLTGINQTSLKISESYLQEFNCVLVETTAHGGARPSHAVWQGSVCSFLGRNRSYPDFKNFTGYGTGDGLGGWGCRHSFFPYFEGISRPAYSPKLLQGYEDRRVTYNGVELSDYEASQKQRAMECAIREVKRELAGYYAATKSATNQELIAGLKDRATKAQAKRDRYEDKMRDFLSQTGRLRESWRESA